MNNEVTIGFIGCGRISSRHFEAIKATPGIRVGVVCDIDRDKAEKAAKLNDVPFVTDLREIKNMDILTVATPSGLHPRHVMEAAQYCDAPYVICEKPISLTVREAVELYRFTEKHGKTILPVYQNRNNPLVLFVKNLIDTGKLGTIYQFNINVYWNRNDDYYKDSWHGSVDMDGGVLYTQASHYVDMLIFFFGTVMEGKGLGGMLRGFPIQDTVSAVMKFKSGVVGSLNATVCAFRKNFMTEATFIAEKGTIRLSGTNLNTIDYWDVEGMEKPDIDFTIDHVYGKGHDTMYEYVARQEFGKFPKYDEVLSGITLMEKLSY